MLRGQVPVRGAGHVDPSTRPPYSAKAQVRVSEKKRLLGPVRSYFQPLHEQEGSRALSRLAVQGLPALPHAGTGARGQICIINVEGYVRGCEATHQPQEE